MRIAFAGGGTGGHVFPIRALIQHIESHPEYKRKVDALVWFGERESLEESVAQELSHVRFVPMVSGKLRRNPSIKEIFENIGDLGRLVWGIGQCLFFLKKYKTDVVFCKGGYVSLPVVVAGRILRKKILLHESDTQAGLSNKICARFATTIFTGFAGVFPKREIVVGQILSDDLIIHSEFTEQNSQGTPEKTNILVTGGSQGAESVYKPLAELIRKNGYVKSHFYVILGTKNIGLRKIFDGMRNVTCYDFASQKEMGELLSLCDVAITRAGTTSLEEQKLFGLKMIIVPLPWTHDQLKNAEYYVKHHGDILVKQDESFLLHFPMALEKIAHHKKQWSNEHIKADIRKAKETICHTLFL